MKRISTILIAFAALAGLLPSCKESGEVITNFEASIQIPDGRIVDGKSATFRVTTNREWSLVSYSLEPGNEKDINFDYVTTGNEIGIKQVNARFDAGTTTFNIAGSGVKVIESHKGKLTLVLKDEETKVERSISATYTAYAQGQITLVIDTPIVRNGQDFQFRFHCAANKRIEYFTVTTYDFPMPGIANYLKLGEKYYPDENGDVRFSIPVMLNANFTPDKFTATLHDNSGQDSEIELTGRSEGEPCCKMLAFEVQNPDARRYISQEIKGNYNLPDPNITLVVKCNGGLSVFDNEGKTKFRIGKEEGSSRNTYTGDNFNIIVEGVERGNASVVLHPLEAGDDASVDIVVPVWVKPALWLLVGGDFSYSTTGSAPSMRNRVLWMYKSSNHNTLIGHSVTSYSMKYYDDATGGGWVGAPNNIKVKFVPCIAGANNTLTNSISMKLLSQENAEKGSLYGLAGAGGPYYPKSDITAILGEGFFEGDISLLPAAIAKSKYDISLTVSGSYAKQSSPAFWYDGNNMAFPTGLTINQMFTANYFNYEFIKQYWMTEHTAPTEAKTFSFNDRMIRSEEFLSSVTPNNDGYFDYLVKKNSHAEDNDTYVYLYKSRNDSDYYATSVYPYKKSTLTGDTDGLVYYLNRWNDCVMYSGRNSGHASDEDSHINLSTHRHPSEWKNFKLAVSSLSYDRTLFDVVGVMYTYKIFDDATSSFFCGGDYWWRNAEDGSQGLFTRLDGEENESRSGITVTHKSND